MENQPTKDKAFENIPWTIEKFTWAIENFSKLDSRTYSETFFLCGYPWRIIMNPKGNKNSLDYLSLAIFLDAGDIANFSEGWSRYVSFELALVNQGNALHTIVKETEQEVNASNFGWSFNKFVHLDKLRNSWNEFIVNDTCIIKARIISVRELEHERLVDQAVSETDSSPTPPISVEHIKHTNNPLPMEISMASCGCLVDFRGLGKVEKAFVPMLEEVCSWHPSLVDFLRKRRHSDSFIEGALTALGRVLHFLKTKKMRDMNEDACCHLQNLWEELQIVGFDLSWLEPYYQSAMGMKSYIERAANVKRQRENLVDLELDLTIIKTHLTEVEKALEGFRR